MDNLQFINEFSGLKNNSTFISLIKYRNEHSEVANYSVVYNINYRNALLKSMKTISDIVPTNQLEVVARQELLDSFRSSLEKKSLEEAGLVYRKFYDENNIPVKGIKLHVPTNTIHLYGLVVHKRIIIPGDYPTRNKRELAIIKDKFRSMTSIGKFRQFKITPNNVDHISIRGNSILISK